MSEETHPLYDAHARMVSHALCLRALPVHALNPTHHTSRPTDVAVDHIPGALRHDQESVHVDQLRHLVVLLAMTELLCPQPAVHSHD